eukprot:5975066-Amphidinium_carterae.1
MFRDTSSSNAKGLSLWVLWLHHSSNILPLSEVFLQISALLASEIRVVISTNFARLPAAVQAAGKVIKLNNSSCEGPEAPEAAVPPATWGTATSTSGTGSLTRGQ